MKSSSGKYFVALDHVRALAAFLVFTWHFTHYKNGYPVPFEFVPDIFVFSIFNEGHTGVALFMTLSGYLFAKLLDGKKIDYAHFLWNRFLRLAPLLLLVLFLVGTKYGLDADNIKSYLWRVTKGIVYPTLPNGGWSVTAEFHFYLILPFLLWIARHSKYALLGIIACMIAFRLYLHSQLGEIQDLSYFTIVGRMDQFLFGIIAYRFSSLISGRHLFVGSMATIFLLFYWWFDSVGGFYHYPTYPSPSLIWIILPTIEGLIYGLIIAWYDNSFSHKTGSISTFIAKIGTYSYSIYLLHFFVVFKMARYIHENLIDISNYYLAFAFSILCFLLMIPIAYISHRYVETPFLKLRTPYLK